MKLLVLGSSGQLGSCLRDQKINYNHEYIFLNRGNINVRNLADIKKNITEIKPDFIINFIAYTAVDMAEEDSENANYLNNIFVKEISKIVSEINCVLIHLSTDYVFEGNANAPYKENSETNPINIYGKTKRLGEIAVQQNCNKYFILRTSWVFSEHGKNFLKTMLNLGNEKSEIQVISDQVGCPTYGQDIAEVILEIIDQYSIDNASWGIYNYSGKDKVSWYEFAKRIFVINQRINTNYKSPNIKQSFSKDIEFKALRPAYSILDNDKILNTWRVKQGCLDKSIETVLKKLKNI
tara:strand:- start:10167 stop:11048 length:882 start_codon:yes stop_codon:yes gene_type:complete